MSALPSRPESISSLESLHLGRTAATSPARSPSSSTLAEDQEKSVLGSKGVDVSTGVKSSSEDGLEEAVRTSVNWSIKGPILCLVLMLNLGQNWINDSLPPLKSTIVKELAINNAQYGDIAAAASLVNTVFPFVTGILIDWYGPELTSILASSAIVLGATISGIGASTARYHTLLSGEIIVGLGSVTIYTAQTKILTYWFYGNHIGFVYGLNVAVGRIINVMALSTSIPIVRGTGSWTYAIWVPAIISLFSLLLNAVYIIFQRRLPLGIQPTSGRERARASRSSRGVSDISTFEKLSWREPFRVVLILPACFWVLTLTQSLQIGAVQAYLNNVSSMISTTRGASNLTAGYTTAVGQIIPIFLTPLIGMAFDRYGKRMWYVSPTAALYVLVIVLVGFTQVNAFVPVIIASVALSCNLMPFLATIPILVPDHRLIGTAFGVWKCFENSGHVILSVAAGAIQDLAVPGPRSYTNVFYMIIGFKSIDIILGFIYPFLDSWYFNGILQMSELQRIKYNEWREAESTKLIYEGRVEERRTGMQEERKGWTIAGLGGGTAMTVAAWIVYLYFAQSSA